MQGGDGVVTGAPPLPVRRPKLLVLFCGAGGAAVGYHRAGFDVVGVDHKPMPHYPFEFHQMDVFEYLEPCWWSGLYFDAIHASPPCQAYSVLRRVNPGPVYPDLVEPTRTALQASGLPWVMETCLAAPLAASIVLCGSMFGLGSGERQLRQHRLFETSFRMLQPPCRHAGEAVETVREKREAMDIDWMTDKEITQAIPPAYTEFIGAELLRQPYKG